LGDLLGMKYYPVLWGFYKPYNHYKDPGSRINNQYSGK